MREKITALAKKLTKTMVLPVMVVSKKITLPGFKGVPLYDVAAFFIRGARESSITLRANAITYSFIIAFVPAIIFLFTLIPYIPVPDLHGSIMGALQEILPVEAFLTIRSTIEDIITRQQRELLSISFLVSMYFASNGIIGIMSAFNLSSHSIETRSSLQKRLISIVLVVILAINLIISGGAMAISSYLLYLMEARGMISNSLSPFLLKAGQWVVILLTSLTAFSTIFYLAPAKRGSFPFFSAGSVLATILSVLIFKIFIIFIENFSHYNTLYGSLGTLIVIIMWINLTSYVLLIGFELNASIYEARKSNPNNTEP